MNRQLSFAVLFASAGLVCGAADCTVAISGDIPGGNVKVLEIKPGHAAIDNELRDTSREWFYWQFEATGDAAGTVRFEFPLKKGRLSAQGPAVSTDGGRTWSWLGKEKSHFRSAQEPTDWFDWTFTKPGEKVRFAQGIPYPKSELDRFLDSQAGTEMKRTVLAKTRKGTEVPLLVIGHGPTNFLMTARHHACEVSASYVLEGILAEILSDSVYGRAFRDRYTLYCVPMVDLDGVLAGDQGKGRAPHDHNRDYGVVSNLYPEVKAIIDLDAEKKFSVALDFHAPALRGDVHEAFYIAGVRTPETYACTEELVAWAHEEFPDFRVLNHSFKLKPGSFEGGQPFSVYFIGRPHIDYASTLEVAYANGNRYYDGNYGRQFGRAFLKAIVRTDFRKSDKPRTACGRLKAIDKSIPARTDQFYDAVKKVLEDPATTPTERVVARNRLALANSRYRKPAEAIAESDKVLAEPWATGRQRGAAIVLKASVLCRDDKATADALAALEKEYLSLAPGLAGSARHDFCDALWSRCHRLGDRAGERRWAELQLRDSWGVQKFRVRNRLSTLDAAEGKKDEALAAARETAAMAKAALDPVPVGVFGPQIALEYARALRQLPETTPEEFQTALDIGLKHPHCQSQTRAELEKLRESSK